MFALADMYGKLHSSRLLIRYDLGLSIFQDKIFQYRHCADLLFEKHPAATPLCAMAKRTATEYSSEICATAMQLMGPEGLLEVDFVIYPALLTLLHSGKSC
jgi:alkylation response protein AidB-like acyl-CoA dehydrogenase